MREIDRRTRISRRVLLRGTAAIPALAAGLSIDPGAVWAADAQALKPATMVTLAKMARDIFPHDQLADVYYIRAVSGYDAAAAKDPATRKLLEEGVAALDAAAHKAHQVPYVQVGWEQQRVVLLEAISGTPFFKKVRGDLVVTLYNQHDLWMKFGYEGASADKGGYIHRGFDDIDWLPQS